MDKAKVSSKVHTSQSGIGLIPIKPRRDRQYFATREIKRGAGKKAPVRGWDGNQEVAE